jgi:hypothetical protein
MNFFITHAYLFFILVAPQFFMELLSTNLALLTFLHPLTFIVLIIIYGFPALLITDAIARWRLSWTGFLTLCLTYGLLNEGIVAKTFFNIYTPNHVGGLEGVFWGINFPWIVSIISVHAVFSMFFPILFARALWPERVTTAFLSNRTRLGLVISTGMVSALIYFTTTDYHPVPFFIIIAVVMAVTAYIAKHWCNNKPFTLREAVSTKTLPVTFGFFIAPTFLIAPFIFANQLQNWIILISIYLVMITFFISAIRRFGWVSQPAIYFVGLGSYIGFAFVGLVALSQGRIDTIVWNLLMIVLFLSVLVRLQAKISPATHTDN